MEDFFRLIRDGHVPAEEQINLFMKVSHNKNPESCEKYFIRPAEAGKSSYEILAEFFQTHQEPDANVLDLGCGIGTLLLFLDNNGPAPFKYSGIDISDKSIDLASDRFKDRPSVSFVEATATRLPFAECTYDFVLSHMALMLMKPVQNVFLEISRVLKPGGYLASVIPSAWRRPAVFNEEMSVKVWEIIKSIYPNYHQNLGGFGQKEFMTKDSIAGLFSENGKFSNVEVMEFDVNFSGHRDEIVSDLGNLYPFEIVPHEIKAKALADFAQFLDKTFAQSAEIPNHRSFALIYAKKLS